jgi:competence protein ComEA
MRKWLYIYFNFSKREYNGLLVMIFILLAITIIPFFFEDLLPENADPLSDSIAIRKLELVEMELNNERHSRKPPRPVQLFSFDPNHTSAADWRRLGLSPKQAAVLIRYTTKGGRFRRKEDLKKMFVVSEKMYQRWSLYIRISPSDSSGFQRHTPQLFVKPKPVLVALNTADTIELDAVKGIGPAFARRIVKYREYLGGFYSKEQLKEIYQMDSIRYNEIKEQLVLDKVALRMIYINRIEAGDLKYHPYLRYKQINAIIQFRKQHGNYSNIAELKKVVLLSAETVEKIAPYISLDHD